MRLLIPTMLVAASVLVSCTQQEGDTAVSQTVSTTAAAVQPTDWAHHKGESCVGCHTTWNLVQIHDASSSGYNSDCISCHGDKTSEVTLSAGVKAIHPFMCPYVYQAAGQTTMNNAVCAYCHQTVDIEPGEGSGGSSGNLRKQVVAFESGGGCPSCHRLAGPGKELYK